MCEKPEKASLITPDDNGKGKLKPCKVYTGLQKEI